MTFFRFPIVLFVAYFFLVPPVQSASGRLRLIIETDAGGDPDDEQSLVRFLLYANEWDVEGIIANRPTARQGENLNSARTGLGIVQQFVKAYGQVHNRLREHAPDFPSPQRLFERTVSGYRESDDGVNLIIAAVDRDDPRPIWFQNWGTDHGSDPSSLKRALDKILTERGQEGYARFKNKIRLCSDDQFGEHTTRIEPPWGHWVYPSMPDIDGGRWYHRFSALTATAGGFDLQRDVLTGHGALGALYPTNTNMRQKEGDTLLFLHLIPTGLSDPMEPTWGSWAGRFGPRDDIRPRNPNYYWANLRDSWQGATNRDNTLKRWAVQIQNDFRARLDWCVKPFSEANHPPQIVLNRIAGTSVLRAAARPGEHLLLDSAGTADPDGNSLAYEWFFYPEPGSYQGTLRIEGNHSPQARVQLPASVPDESIHIVLAVTDSGQPALTRYRRMVVRLNP